MFRRLISTIMLLERIKFKQINYRTIANRARFNRKTANTGASNGQNANDKSIRWGKWTPLPVGVGLTYVAYQQYGHVREREENKLGVVRESKMWKPWQIRLYTSLPLRMESRLWGWLSTREIPEFLRGPILGLFARTFGVDLSEACEQDLTKYTSLNEFFRRELKPELRPLGTDCMLAPSDGVVQVCGRMVNDRIEQVKGYSYSLEAFVGEDLAKELKNRERKDPNGQLYYCVIYLSPADCHKFFSPVQWKIDLRRHITGYLLSVNKAIVNRIPYLFSINERVLLTGEWEHGFFSMTPVGATHVGSIKLGCEEGFKTNVATERIGSMNDKRYGRDVNKNRGDYVGEFNMGSSVVLIFEAPYNFDFTVKPGDQLKYGQSMGRL